MKFKPLIQQPILNHQAITECIQQGHHWNGIGFSSPLREFRHGKFGELTSQQQGGGIDFSETRAYQAGDEPRHINWRATARTGRPQVRVFHKDLSPSCYFLIDRRASMRFGTRTRLKVTQAARLAIFLASWEAKNGTELGSLILNKTPQWNPAMSGQQGIYQLAQFASSSCPPLDTDSAIDMKHALALLTEQIPQGSYIYLLSDFYDLEEEMLPQLYKLGQQHIVRAIGIYDSAEQHLPKAGHLHLLWNQQDIFQHNPLIDTRDASVQNKYRMVFEQKQLKIKHLCEKAEISLTSVCSHADSISSALQVASL